MPKWLPLMRTGTFTDQNGLTYNVTQDTLRKVQENYSNERPAHLVVGHPDPLKRLAGKVPSFGLVDKLKVIGDGLFWRPARVVAEFAELVKKGAFPDVSAGFDPLFNRLDHIAFLSAQRPAISGLEPICEFSAPASSSLASIGVSDIVVGSLGEFSSYSEVGWRLRSVGDAMRSLRDWIIEKFDLETADRVLPDWTVKNLQEPLPEEPVAGPQFSSEGGNEMTLQEALDALAAERAKTAELSGKIAEFSAQVTTIKQDRDGLKATVDTLTADIAKINGEKQLAEFGAFVDKLIDDKKLLPARRQEVIDEMTGMAKASTLAEFSAGTSPLEVYRKQLESMPAGKVPGSEHTVSGPEFSAPGGEAQVLANQISDYQAEQAKAGKTVSGADALRHIKARQA